MKRITILAGVAALFAIIFVAAPWFALHSLQAAARDGDVQALTELVDYDAVRRGLRSQLAATSSVPAPKVWEDPFGALSRAMQGQQTPAAEIDRHLTPGGLHALIGDPQVLPAVRYWGPARVRFAVGPQQATLLTFRRSGFARWRLVQLHLPNLRPATARE